MEKKVTVAHVFGSAALLMLGAAGMAGFIAYTAQLANISGVEFLPIFVVYALLYVPTVWRRLAQTIAVGPQGRAGLMAVRSEYMQVVAENPRLRAWPESTVGCVLAAASILVRASFRAWVILIVAVALSKLFGTTVKSEISVLWSVFTCIEAVLIAMRSYNQGTLPLVGMTVSEMEVYVRERINEGKGGYLSPGP